ncbi:MAG: MFS transporter [Mycobacterium leprae]
MQHTEASLWRHREFLKLWGGQSFSVFGSLISRIALPFLLIYTLNATTGQIAWLRAAESAPGLLIALIAGVWIDRMRRRPIMIAADLLRILLVGSIPLALWLGHLSLLQVFLVAIPLSVLTVCFDVAYEAYLPTLVGPEQINTANARLAAGSSVAEIAGFGFGGALFQLFGGALTLALDAVSYLVSVVTLLWIRHPEPEPGPADGEHESFLKEAREGVHVLAIHPVLRPLSGIVGLNGLYGGAMNVIYVLFISRTLLVPAGIQGVLYGLGGISSLIGATLSAAVLRRLGMGRTLIVTEVIALLAVTLVAVAHGPFWLVLPLLVAQQLIGDGADTISLIQVTSLRQTLVPNAVLGRVNASWRVLCEVAVLVGTLLTGLLSNAFSLRTLFLLAIAVRVVGFVWLLASPLRHLQQTELTVPE